MNTCWYFLFISKNLDRVPGDRSSSGSILMREMSGAVISFALGSYLKLSEACSCTR